MSGDWRVLPRGRPGGEPPWCAVKTRARSRDRGGRARRGGRPRVENIIITSKILSLPLPRPRPRRWR